MKKIFLALSLMLSLPLAQATEHTSLTGIPITVGTVGLNTGVVSMPVPPELQALGITNIWGHLPLYTLEGSSMFNAIATAKLNNIPITIVLTSGNGIVNISID